MKKLVSLVAVLFLLVSVLPASVVQGASKDPYCRISYDANLGLQTVKYYKFVNDVAVYDATHLIKIDGSTLRVGTSNTQVTKDFKAGSNVSWDTSGNYVIWTKSNNVVYAWSLSTQKNQKLADQATSVNLNYDSFAETVSFSNGSSQAVSALISSGGASSSSNSSSSSSSSNGGGSNSSTTPSSSQAQPELKEYTDANGAEIFEFGSYKLKVAPSKVILTANGKSYNLSEQCNTGVKYLGISKQSSKYYIFLYEEDAIGTERGTVYYRFCTTGTEKFTPTPVILDDNGTSIMKSVVNDKNGFMDKVVTSTRTYDAKELVVADKFSYAINKKNYAYLYTENATFKMCRNGTNLTFNNTFITGKMSKNTAAQFGFDEENIYYIVSGIEYTAPLNNPTRATAVASGVKKLVFDSENGFVAGVRMK